MIETVRHRLPHGIELSCRIAGQSGRPVLLFLHGFPEAAFAWDELMEHFSRPEHGGHRCVAPNLRGFADSSRPSEVSDYRAKHLVQDIAALIQIESGTTPLAALVAHDWGGAVAWNLANQRPDLMQRLVVLNSPHPGTFWRELRDNPEQQAASAYMNFLIRPDAEQLLVQNDFNKLWSFAFEDVSHSASWLDATMRARYREVWSQGLQGGLNYYCASPLRPPRPDDAAALGVELPSSMCRIEVPTLVLWGLRDRALLPCLLDGLHDHVPQLTLHTHPKASHWIVHEQAAWVMAHMARFLQS
jgi:pimeloyl-ACP methyl ester carboxylesterase